MLPPGQHTLTLHQEPPGEFPDCDGGTVVASAPITAAPGDRLLVFPYRLPGAATMGLLVLDFGVP